jgi:hypothetical protein
MLKETRDTSSSLQRTPNGARMLAGAAKTTRIVMVNALKLLPKKMLLMPSQLLL